MYDIKKIWPKWDIVRTIGAGSFGKVYEIVRNEYGVEEHSALKVISIPQSDSEVQALKNDGMTLEDTAEYFKGVVNDFVQEIQLMTQLKGNTNVVAYEDFAVVEKADSVGFDILIRMELLTGLPVYLRENRFRVYDVIQLAIDMCRALEVCRELSIVHRDIKPDNIFVSANHKFKLGDFGVARTIEKTMAGLSRKGTYSYMAPEIYNGKEYGFEADIYSLGIVLYKLLNNNRDPFLPPYPAPVKYSDKTEAMIKRIQGLPMPAPVNADEKLARIIFKACAHNPNERYLHPKDLRMELETIALGYAELQSEVFAESGISYYTNNSIFGTEPKSMASIKSNVSVVDGTADKEEYVDDDEEEGTLLLEETTDEGTMIDPTNFISIQDEVVPVEEPEQEKVEPIQNDPVIPAKDVEEEPVINAEESVDDGEDSMEYIDLTDEGTWIDPSNYAFTQGERSVKNDVKAIREDELRCAVCNNIIKPGTLFCGHCGHKLKEEKKPINYCPKCGSSTAPGSKFCGKCGYKF